jgi:hypothetical protein
MNKKGENRKCEHCNNEFYVYPYRLEKARFCSAKCRANVICKTEKFRSEAKTRNKERGIKPPTFTGHSEESKKQIAISVSKAKTGIKRPNYSGDRHHSWKGGITSESKRLRNSMEGKQWRRVVLERDQHTCMDCGSNENLEVHHIYTWADNPTLRTNAHNGITLCKECHTKTKNKEWQFLQRFAMLAGVSHAKQIINASS